MRPSGFSFCHCVYVSVPDRQPNGTGGQNDTQYEGKQRNTNSTWEWKLPLKARCTSLLHSRIIPTAEISITSFSAASSISVLSLVAFSQWLCSGLTSRQVSGSIISYKVNIVFQICDWRSQIFAWLNLYCCLGATIGGHGCSDEIQIDVDSDGYVVRTTLSDK
jgi:hypothetical protein